MIPEAEPEPTSRYEYSEPDCWQIIGARTMSKAIERARWLLQCNHRGEAGPVQATVQEVDGVRGVVLRSRIVTVTMTLDPEGDHG
jgi:hypothetical protein